MYTRQKCGKGFTYKDEDGKPATKAERERIQKLMIPPAWKFVEISGDPDEKILATGRDEKNRKQYIYNPKFRSEKQQEKFDRILHFAENLEHMRRVTGQHMRRRKMDRNKVLATMVRLLDSAYFRPGSAKYTHDNGSYGLTTVRSKHLKIKGDELIFSYRGKSGKDQERHVVDKRIAKIVAELDEMPGYEIFKFIDAEGNIVDVESKHLNAYIREVMGEDFSAKDFRTWGGTMIAALALEELGVCTEKSQKEMDRQIKAAVVKVSEKLGNTPAVARSSYIDPRIIDSYIDGKTVSFFRAEVDKMLKSAKNLSAEELGVLCILRSRLSAE